MQVYLRSTVTLALLLCLTGVLTGQEPLPAPADAAPTATSQATVAPATDSNSATSTAEPVSAAAAVEQLAQQRTAYIPYRDFLKVFERQSAAVFVPYAEYLRLLERAWPVVATSEPPVPIVISAASYRARVDEDLATINAELEVAVLKEGWVELPLRFGDAAIGQLQAATGRAYLRGDGAGSYFLLMHDVGTHKLTLQLTARVRTSPEGRSLELDIPSAGITNFELGLPEADQVIEVRPRLLTRAVEAAAGETRVAAAIGATERITATWHARAGLSPEMELLSSVTNQTLVSIEDDLIHTDTWLNYDVLRGQLTQMRIAVPAGDRVLDVNASARIREWAAETTDGRQIITVNLLAPASGKVQVEVHTERPLPEQQFDVVGRTDETDYGIHALDVLREGGYLALKGSADLTVSVVEQAGLSRVEESEVDGQIRRPGASYYRFYNPSVRLQLRAETIQPRLVANHNTNLIFNEDRLLVYSSTDWTIERAGVFELKYTVPKNVVIESATGPAVRQYDLSADGTTLTLLLHQKTIGLVQVQIRSFVALNAAENVEFAELPLLEPLGLDLEYGNILVLAPAAIDVITNVSDVVGARPNPASPDSSWGDARLVSSWLYNRRPVKLPARTMRKPTRLTSVVATQLSVKPGQVGATVFLNFDVEYSGLDTFRFDVPADVSERLQLSLANTAGLPGIKQQSHASQPVDGWVTWTVVLQRPMVGRVPFVLRYDVIPREATNSTVALMPLIKAREPFDGPAGGAAALGEEGEVPAPADAATTDPQPDAAPAATDDADTADTDDTDASTSDPAAMPDDGAAATGADAATGTTLPGASGSRYVPLAHVNGEVIVAADATLTVSAVASEAAEAIDVRELEHLPADGFQAFRYFEQPVQVELTATRFETQSVVATVISRELVEAVLDRSGTLTVRARYRLKSSERQRLPLALPAGIEPLGVLIDNRPVPLEKQPAGSAPDGYEPYLINVGRTESAEQPFSLTVLYRLPLKPAPFENFGGRVLVRLPQLGGVASSTVATQELRVAVWVPREYALVRSPRDFIAATRQRLGDLMLVSRVESVPSDDLQSWIGVDGTGVFDFPTQGRRYVYSNLGGVRSLEVAYWHLPFYTAIVSGVIVLIALALRNTSLENQLTVLIVTALVAIIAGLRDIETVTHLLAVSLYGLVALVLIWTIAAFLRLPRGLSSFAAGVTTPTMGNTASMASAPHSAPAMTPTSVADSASSSAAAVPNESGQVTPDRPADEQQLEREAPPASEPDETRS